MAALKWTGGITSIRYVPDLGTTPAAVNRETGEMLINKRIWATLTPDQRFFILLHEAGHMALKSQDEKKVDAWAFKEYEKRGYRLSQSIYALTKVLNFSNPEHFERANLQLARAQKADKKRNGKKTQKNQKIGNLQGSESQRHIKEGLPIRKGWPSSQSEKISDMDTAQLSNGMSSFSGKYERADGASKFKNTLEDIEDVVGTFTDIVFRRDKTDPTAVLAANIQAENAALKKELNEKVTGKNYTTYYIAGGIGLVIALILLLKK